MTVGFGSPFIGKAHRSERVFGSFVEYNKKRPSHETSRGVLPNGVTNRGRSSAEPFAGLMNTSDAPNPLRLSDRKIIWVLSTDQRGENSDAGSNVNRVATPRDTSVNQIS